MTTIAENYEYDDSDDWHPCPRCGTRCFCGCEPENSCIECRHDCKWPEELSDDYFNKPLNEADTTNVDYELAEILQGGQGRSSSLLWLYALTVAVCAALLFFAFVLIVTLH